MIKRFLDIVVSFAGLIITGPIIIAALLMVWLQDGASPFYFSERVGRNGRPFTMIKIRSMVVNADKSKVDSTSADDKRITPVGKLIRKIKLDELIQLTNVFSGQMSLVGPRPNVKREVDLYTQKERKLLTVKPGITDPSSIIFSDLADILMGTKDANIAYNQLVRPWKGRISLLYLQNSTIFHDATLIYLTLLSIINRKSALRGVARLLEGLGASKKLLVIAERKQPLIPAPPLGGKRIVQTRKI